MRTLLIVTILAGVAMAAPARASLFLDSWGVAYDSWDPSGFSGYVDYWVEDWTPDVNPEGWLGPGGGGDDFDIEAVYFGADASSYYFAVVTGFGPAGAPGWDFEPGDLFLDIGNDGTWDYAFDESDGGLLVSGITGLENPSPGGGETFGGQSDPFRVTSYTGPTYSGHDWSYAPFSGRYAIEARVPRTAIGPIGDYHVHWTMGCGNDTGDLVGTTVPEPASLVLLGLGLAGAGWARHRRRA